MTDPTRMDGAALIAAERRRQVEAEGWTHAHDDEHDDRGGDPMTGPDRPCREAEYLKRAQDAEQVIWDLWRGGYVLLDEIRELGPAGYLAAQKIKEAAGV